MPRLPRVVAAHPHPSTGALLEGPRRGTRPACGPGWVRRGGAGPGCRGAAGRSGQQNREQREEEGEERERADVRALASRGRKRERRERSGWERARPRARTGLLKGKGGRGKRKETGPRGEGSGENGLLGRGLAQGGERSRPGWADFFSLISFSFLFQTNSILFEFK
jgi:hypothetical protein